MKSRPAQADDLDSLFELHCAVFRAHIEEIWGWDEQWQRSRFKLEFESSMTSVVQIAGRTVGYVQTNAGPDHIYLRNIALRPEVQGRGLGTILVRQLQQQAAERGVRLDLSVFRINRRAQVFYERLGFRRTGTTDTHIEMSWREV